VGRILVLEGFDFGVGMLSLAMGREDRLGHGRGQPAARVCLGGGLTDLVHGLRLSPAGLYLGSFWILLTPVAILGGLACLAMFLAHGAAFLSLKTAGPLAGRARHVATWVSPLAGALVAGIAVWLAVGGSDGTGGLGGTVPVALAVVGALFVPFVLIYQGWSFWVFRQRLTRPTERPRAFPRPIRLAAAGRLAGRRFTAPPPLREFPPNSVPSFPARLN
jgi:cytochrome bd-type quinol oxidase subunit 2